MYEFVYARVTNIRNTVNIYSLELTLVSVLVLMQ